MPETPQPIDVEHLLSWVGRQAVAEDVLTPALVEKFSATFNMRRESRGPAPRMIHLCLAQNIPATRRLAADGRPEREDFLPPVPLPQRTCVSGRIEFHTELFAGDKISRISKIAQVDVTGGAGGRACSVTVQNRLTANGLEAISEEQVIVYRAPGPAPMPPPAPPGTSHTNYAVNEATLFRYAALTFDAHRIHYDRNYATGVEGYPGLVVSGPLQATLLVDFAGQLLKSPVRRFSFRAVAPLIEGGPVGVHAVQEGDALQLWTAAAGGPQAMIAQAQ